MDEVMQRRTNWGCISSVLLSLALWVLIILGTWEIVRYIHTG